MRVAATAAIVPPGIQVASLMSRRIGNGEEGSDEQRGQEGGDEKSNEENNKEFRDDEGSEEDHWQESRKARTDRHRDR